MNIDHILGHKAHRMSPPLRGTVNGVVQLEPIRIFPGNGFQLFPEENVLFGWSGSMSKEAEG